MSIVNRPRVVSLYSGAGCFDLGFEAAGFQTVLATDINQDCCDTIIANRGWTTIHAPIESISDLDFKRTAGLRARELELLIGGPPCQPYSKSANVAVGGSPLGFEDERSVTVREYVRAVDCFLPKVFVIENVPQFVSGPNVRVRDYIQRSIARINASRRTNYRLTFCKINAAWFGVPQIRDRMFIIGSRNGCHFEMPQIRFLNDGDIELEISPYRTTWDAIGGSSRPREELRVGGKWGNLLNSIPPGQNYLWHTPRGGGRNVFKWRGRYWNFLLKLHPLMPSWTIAANPGQHTGPFHWDNHRLTVSELQALQTIPSDYVFAGGIGSVRRQIGNGVPSAIGELLGKEIRRQLLGERVSSANLKLIPEKRPLSRRIRLLTQSLPKVQSKESRASIASNR